MRIEPYNSLDEIVTDAQGTTQAHDGNVIPISGIPDRLKILVILADKFYEPVLSICEKIRDSDVEKIDMLPSEFIKAANNLQRSYKFKQTVNKDVIVSNYIKLVNLGIKKRKYIVDKANDYIQNNEQDFTEFQNTVEKKRVIYFADLLRACSEVLYFDNHTTVCDNIDLRLPDTHYICKLHKDLFSEYMYKNCPFATHEGFNIYLGYCNFNLEFDMIGNYSSNQNPINNLKKWHVEVVTPKGKKNISGEDLEIYIQRYEKILKEYVRTYSSLGEIELLRLVLRSIYQVNVPIFDYFGVDYDYDEAMLNLVVQNYSDPRLLSSEKIFKHFPHSQALEYIFNPNYFFKGELL